MKSWIVSDRDCLNGAARVRGTRISVALLLESFAAGMSIDEIVESYPALTPAAVQGVLFDLASEKKKAA